MKRASIIFLALLFAVPSRFAAAQTGDTGSEADASEDAAADELQEEAVKEKAAEEKIESASKLPVSIRPTIKTILDKRTVGLGEVVHLTVSIRRRPDHEFHLPQEVSFEKLDLLDKKVETLEKEKNWKTDQFSFKLIALEPGLAEIPPLRFGGVTKSGDVVYLETHKIEVAVRDPTTGQVEAKIKDVADVKKVYEKNYMLLYLLGVLAGVFLIISIVWYMARNWEKWHPRAPLAPPPPRPPEDVAYEQLRALETRPPVDEESKKKWYFDLSEVMRLYLANRFDFNALESTSEEIIKVMKMKKTVGITQAELWKFLLGCDMVKFAKYRGPAEEDKEIIEEAFGIVDVTTPRREEAGKV